ncbi:hypothetical protein LZ32DRAFT_614589 [Colletotrichum eremochloae]|nr:hypothetical protein LZ32DRAFT_614589 [Colletotrichum eremochloae]
MTPRDKGFRIKYIINILNTKPNVTTLGGKKDYNSLIKSLIKDKFKYFRKYYILIYKEPNSYTKELYRGRPIGYSKYSLDPLIILRLAKIGGSNSKRVRDLGISPKISSFFKGIYILNKRG